MSPLPTRTRSPHGQGKPSLRSDGRWAVQTMSRNRVNRIRHGDYEVPGSLNGRTYRIRGTDPLALACDCPAGRLGRDCYHRSAVAIRITVERTLGSPRQSVPVPPLAPVVVATGVTARGAAPVPWDSVAPDATAVPPFPPRHRDRIRA